MYHIRKPTDWKKDNSWKKRKGFTDYNTWSKIDKECEDSLKIIRPGKKKN